MAKKLSLHWSEYKSHNGSRSVWFNQFTIYVDCDEWFRGKVRKVPWWNVVWYDEHGDRIKPNTVPGLTNKKFKTRREAQVAAERFVNLVAKIAVRMVDVKFTVGVGK